MSETWAKNIFLFLSGLLLTGLGLMLFGLSMVVQAATGDLTNVTPKIDFIISSDSTTADLQGIVTLEARTDSSDNNFLVKIFKQHTDGSRGSLVTESSLAKVATDRWQRQLDSRTWDNGGYYFSLWHTTSQLSLTLVSEVSRTVRNETLLTVQPPCSLPNRLDFNKDYQLTSADSDSFQHYFETDNLLANINGNDSVDAGDQLCADSYFAQANYSCQLTCPSYNSVCGDGHTDIQETCDDSNTVGGDGCSSGCQLEASANLTPTCGNGLLEGQEECDDGNTVSSDSCNQCLLTSRHQYGFSIESDSGTYSGTIYFVATSTVASTDQLLVFIYSADNVPLTDVRLTADPSQSRWQGEYDTKQLTNGYYSFRLGSLVNGQRLIWHQGSNNARVFNARVILTEEEIATQQILAFVMKPETEIVSGELQFQASSDQPYDQSVSVFIRPETDSDQMLQVVLLSNSQKTAWQGVFNADELAAAQYNFKLAVTVDNGLSPLPKSTTLTLLNQGYSREVRPSTTPETADLATSTAATSTSPLETGPVVEEPLMTLPIVTADCRQLNISDPLQCQKLLSLDLASDCLSAGLKTAADCDAYQRQLYLAEVCRQRGIINMADCEAIMSTDYQQKIDCGSLAEVECRQIIQEQFLGQLITSREDEARTFFRSRYQQVMPASQLRQNLNEAGLESGQLAVRADQTTAVKILPAVDKMAIIDKETLRASWPAVLVFDSDNDGLSDDQELRFGTKKDTPDSDGDGYLDGDEVKNGYDPLGPGKFTKELAPIDKALLSGQPLEQPVVSGQTSADLAVGDVSNFPDQEGLRLSGLARPMQTVTLFIYSGLPLVLTTTADAGGNWTYYLNEPLSDSRHQIYATVTDETGKLAGKSQAFNFFVRQARAISADEFLNQTPLPLTSQTPDKNIFYFIIGGLALILLAIIIFIIVHLRRRPAEI